MATHEDKVNDFIKQIGATTELAVQPGDPPTVKVAQVDHMGLRIQVGVDNEALLTFDVAFGYVPKTNIAPLFRRLLALNGTIAHVAFGLFEKQNILKLQTSRSLEGLDFVEFKSLLDAVGQIYWQYVPGLIQEFQLPQQPT